MLSTIQMYKVMKLHLVVSFHLSDHCWQVAALTDVGLCFLLEASTVFCLSLSHCHFVRLAAGFSETRQSNGWIFVPCWKRSNKMDITTLRLHYNLVSVHMYTQTEPCCVCVYHLVGYHVQTLSHQRAASAYVQDNKLSKAFEGFIYHMGYSYSILLAIKSSISGSFNIYST